MHSKLSFISFILTVQTVEIGLMATTYVVTETDGSTALLEVCAVLNNGTIEQNVTVNLISTDGSATSTGIVLWVK